MTRRFHCTACGKCCYGQLPLSWKDAVAQAHRFPIAIVWTPVLQGSRDFKQVKDLGVFIKLPDRRELASLIVPTSFIPSTFPCPALSTENLCSIHKEKPARCKSMPFYPYRDERLQADNLILKKDWQCDTSDAAPVIYENQKVLQREDFDLERAELIDQVPILRRYAEYMFKYTPAIVGQLAIAASKQTNAHIVTSLSSFLTAIRYPETKLISSKQLPVLKDFAEKTLGKSEYSDFHRRYTEWIKEMTYLSH